MLVVHYESGTLEFHVPSERACTLPVLQAISVACASDGRFI